MGVEKLVGVIGWPVAHSLSPRMHNHAFSALGLHDWRYAYLPVETSNRIEQAVLGLRALGFIGANVTVPYKEQVWPHLDSLSDEASNIGAVNTIHVKDGLLLGHNTDARGFTNDLFDHGIDINSTKVLILGAGGSARAIVYGLLAEGCQSITILNRTRAKADEIALSLGRRFSATIKTGTLDKEDLRDNRQADLIINTTSVGLQSSEESIWDKDIQLSSHQVAYDLIYGRRTRFLDYAATCGAKTIDGLGMLVHQGALSFAIWTGLPAPVEIMKRFPFCQK